MIEHVITEDGSSSLYVPELDEHYHSSHGALQEALHVFIDNGFSGVKGREIKLFEMGFGTGLNALLTMKFGKENAKKIEYHGIEAFPISEELVKKLNYPELVAADLSEEFFKMHDSDWGELTAISEAFSLKKIHERIEEYDPVHSYFDIVYFDAFGFRAQEDMWDIGILQKMYEMLKPEGILVTYAARGQFKRDLKTLGFKVEALAGPPGKREMTRAVKV